MKEKLEIVVKRLWIGTSLLIIAANLALLGVPVFSAALQIRLGWYVCVPAWSTGLVTILAPWVCKYARRRALDIFLASLAAAYFVTLGCAQLFDAPAFATCGYAAVFVESFLCTWSLAGGFGLGVAALFRPLRATTCRLVGPDEVVGAIACFAPDPATRALPQLYGPTELDDDS